jgi:hypothetical protein
MEDSTGTRTVPVPVPASGSSLVLVLSRAGHARAVQYIIVLYGYTIKELS